MADRKAKASATKAATAKVSAPKPRKAARAKTQPVKKAEAAKPASAPAPKPVVAKTAPAALETAQVAARAVRKSIETSETVATKLTEGTKTMTNDTIDRVQETQKVAADRMQAVFGDVNERAKGAMERSARMLEEMTELTKGNVEAIVASSKAAARGVESLSQEAAEYGRKSFEEVSTVVRNLAEVRSATDFFRLQSEYARAQFDSMVAESSKVSETMIKLAGEVAEPITNRYSVAAERVKNIAA